MGKLFLYGRTESKNRITPYAKLTVNCPPNVTVRAESQQTHVKIDVHSGNIGKAVFEKLDQGNWNLTFVDVMYPPSKVVAISSLDYEITMGTQTSMTYAMQRPVESEVEYNATGIEESFSATIRVTYPEGSICTCSNERISMTAVDTSGYYEFVVPIFGEWSVTCANGKHTRTTVVLIEDDGQTENVVLDYTTYLYNTGVDCIAWRTKDNNGSVSRERENIVFNASASQFGPSYITATKQDLSNVDAIFVNCVSSTASLFKFTVCIRDTNAEIDNFEEDCIAYSQLNSKVGVLELDVSNFSGSYFIEILYSSDEPSTGVIDSVYCI